jgi:hypothetical protein
MSQFRRVVLVGVVGGVFGLAWLAATRHVQSQPPPEAYTATAVPQGQSYVGTKRCSSCHFKQYTAWKKTKHCTEAWAKVPTKYRRDPECVKCHVTGYGVKSGYAAGTDPAVLQNLLGVTCEACHGPGSKHEAVCKKYSSKKKLDPAEEKEARGSIYKILPQNVCIRCHLEQNHKEHPKYDKS